MNAIFLNSKNSKTSDPHILLLNLPYKITLRTKYKYIALSSLGIYYTWNNIKSLHLTMMQMKLLMNSFSQFVQNIKII